MNKIKSNINLFFGIIVLFLSVINLFISSLNCLYRPKNYVVFGLVYLTTIVFMVVLSLKNKNVASKPSKIFAELSPIIALIYLISLFICIDLKIDYINHNILCYEVLFLFTIVSSLIIFFAYNNIILLRFIVSFISFLAGVLFVFLVVVFQFITNFGTSEILQTAISPNSTYVARVVYYDSGALGDKVYVNVYDNKNKVTFLTGAIIDKDREVWTGEWVSAFYWEDDDTIFINGAKYDIKKEKI